MAGLTWLAFIGIVFRLEIGVLGFIAAIVFSLVFGQSNVFTNLILLAFGTFFGAALSFLVDSHFWGYNVIPELSAFVFNVVEGKSADWGVEPYAAYFKKYIPQLFSPPVVLLLLPLGLLSDPSDDGLVVLDDHKQVIHRPSWNSLRALFISAILFVAVMSIQPHKEWRFIIYIVPALTLVAGYGISSLVDKSLTSWSRRVTVFVMVAFVGVSFISSCSKAYISSFNYPGGEALRLVNQLAVNSNSSKQILIHLDVPTCMTGASRFGELHNQRVVYDKTEDPSELNKIWEHIDFLVTEVRVNDPVWEKAASVQKFSQISLYPVVSLFQQHPTKEKLVKHLANTFVDSFKTMDFSAFKEFVDSAVLKTDYIYIYRRINSEPGEPIAETYSKIEELEEPDMEEVKEQINEQIDELEQ
ncbi:hypothetical protein CANTEDRAFT_104497 [Yamadazyma tenuis ATCC 10573]|nr:uncharacterized protein CANTEDRAFT_104497 [Yamadazyma tenuis ATCC 10573]EGV64521.1 hypothetical protein CANTEDRAFT_104497 [Yamadazyma tenuis ATCC 10573]